MLLVVMNCSNIYSLTFLICIFLYTISNTGIECRSGLLTEEEVDALISGQHLPQILVNESRSACPNNSVKIITDEERHQLIAWTMENHATHFIPNQNSPHRYYLPLHHIPTVPSFVFDIRNRLIELEGLQYEKPTVAGLQVDDNPEGMIPDYISCITAGGQIHPHTDINDVVDKLFHTRYNIFVQSPQKGGRPIYNGITYNFTEGSYIRCRAGLDEHYCEKVEGDLPRIVLSFGFLLPIDKLR
jgi:hypothetical protein